MVRNGPLEKKGRRRRLWPFGRGGNRRVRPSSRLVAEVAREGGAPEPVEVDRTIKNPRRFPWRRLAQLAIVLVATGALATGVVFGRRFLLRSPKFAVKTIRVTGNHHLVEDAVRARSGIALGTNLFRVDLAAATRALEAEPWIESARVRRELPGTIAVDVTEREPACVLAFGPLYLADARGVAWKRATPDEAAGLPVVTGVPRDGYVVDREASQALVREAVAALAAWRERPDRPAIGEAHVDPAAGVTLYTATDGVAIRIGRPDTETAWRERLARYDAVAAELARNRERPVLVLVDGRARPDRVTVRLAN